MFNHYLTVGGNEVVNSERSYRYVTTANCAVQWLRDPDCGTVADAEEVPEYNYADIETAPWFDPDIADVTGRFYGLYGLEFAGFSDSTRSIVVTERNGDGAEVSGYRHASREVRVRAWMTAQGMDAMEAGMTWLRNVLEPDACGVHGGSCGQTDAAFFVGCPPAREQIPEFSDWETVAVNRAMNPIADSSWLGVYGTGGAGTTSTVSGVSGAPARRIQWTTVPTAGLPGIHPSSTTALRAPVTAGETQEVWVDLASSGPSIALSYVFGDALGDLSSGTTDYQSVSNNTALPTRTVFLTPAAPAGATFMTVRLVVQPAETAINDWITASRLYVGSEDFGYFDGDFVGDDLTDYSWSGPVNAAPSIYATRTQGYVEESDSSYYPRVDEYRRFLHSVRCISGPFVVQEAVSADKKFNGRMVEFSLVAQVPWVFGLPRVLDVPPLTPTVVQDIAYNLAPYPSAELSSGTVVVATNYSTNPSVESNITGWANGSNAALTAGGTVAAVARSTELKAVGAASAMVEFTASAAGSAGLLRVEQSVALGGGANSRYSINMWSSAVNNVGSAVLGQITLFALWQDAGSATLRVDNLGSLGASGGAITASSILPPASATKVIVRAELAVTSWSTGNKIRLFGDALAVTNP